MKQLQFSPTDADDCRDDKVLLTAVKGLRHEFTNLYLIPQNIKMPVFFNFRLQWYMLIFTAVHLQCTNLQSSSTWCAYYLLVFIDHFNSFIQLVVAHQNYIACTCCGYSKHVYTNKNKPTIVDWITSSLLSPWKPVCITIRYTQRCNILQYYAAILFTFVH